MKDPLSILNLVNFARAEWVDNPLVQMMRRRVRKFYVYIVAFQVVVLVVFQFIPRLMTWVGWTARSTAIIMSLLYLLSGFFWLVKAIIPIFYADWAYREIWMKDETLRISQLTFRDWLAAVMLPLMQLAMVLFFTGFVLYLITFGFALWQFSMMAPNLQSFSVSHFVLWEVVGMFSMIINYGMMMLLAITLVLRRIMQLADGGPTASALPRLALPIAVFAAMLFVCGVPQFFGTSIFGWNSMTLLLVLLLHVLIYTISLAVIFLIVRYMWRRDLQVARNFLFRASGE